MRVYYFIKNYAVNISLKYLKGTNMRSKITNLIISLVIFLSFIEALEIILRLTHIFGAHTSFYKHDPVLGYRYIPNSKYWFFEENDHPIIGKINSYGWRDKGWSLKKPENTFRIAILGDSMVASLDVESDRSFVAITERQLNKNENRSIELMNFGFLNISQAEELLILQNDVVKFSPDMVVLFFFPVNDIDDMSKETASHLNRPFFNISESGELILDTSFSQTRHYKIKSSLDWFKQHSALITLIGERYYGFKEQRRSKTVDMSEAKDKKPLQRFLSLCTENPDALFLKNYQLNKTLIKAMSEYCKNKCIKFILVTVDVPSYNPEIEKRYKSKDTTFNAKFFENDLRNYAESLNIGYLGLQSIFQQIYKDTGLSLHWIHWNYQGHKVVADVLTNKLKSIIEPNQQ